MLAVPASQVDLFRFEQLLSDGKAALADGRVAEGSHAIAEALGLWRGPALAEFSEPFAEAEGSRLEELRLHALEERIEADLALGRHAALVGELDALVAGHPLRERLRGQQMLALYRSGRQAEALAAYHELRRALDEELGIAPSASLRDLERRILQQEASLDPVDARGEVTLATRSKRAPAPFRSHRPPPIGREAELERLQSLLTDALHGERQVVFLSGEAGIGKTTLVTAFVETVADDELLVARGECVEQHGAGEAYLPVLDALSRLCRAPSGSAVLEILKERAPSWVLQLPGLVDPQERELIELRALAATRDRMLREMNETLEALTASHPLVLVLEDLHWSDPSTLDLLSAIGRRSEPSRLLVVATFRPVGPGLPGATPVAGLAQDLAARGCGTGITVQPLDEKAVTAYLSSRLDGGSFPSDLPELLQRRTNGNPLFVEKVVDAWIEDEQVPTGDLVGNVPASLKQLIEQRVSELGEAAEEILDVASVAGPEFSAALVAAACDRGADAVESSCDVLARHGAFLESRGVEEWPDGTIASRYGFTHDLCHEVLYQRLPAGRRARLHRKLGARIADAYGEAAAHGVAAELAVHFLRGGDADRAVHYLALAADTAGERRAYREAVTHLRSGLELLPKIADDRRRDAAELDFQIRLGPALIGLEGFGSDEAEAALRRARELAERLGRNDELAFALFSLGTVHEVRGEYLASEAFLGETLSLPTPASAGILVDSREILACSLFHQGAFGQALGQAEEALSRWTIETVGWRTVAYGENPGVSCHTWAALALWFLGRPDTALDRARSAIQLPDTQPALTHARAFAYAQAAIVSQLRLEPQRCLEFAERAIEDASRDGYTLRLAAGVILRGWALAALGDAETGVAEITRGLGLSRSTGARMDDAYYLGLLADALAGADRRDDALRVLDEGLGAVRTSRAFFYEAELHRLRGEILLAMGETEGGERSLRDALEVARRQESPSLELRAAISLSRHGRDGESLAGAYRRFTEGFDTPDLRTAEGLLAELGMTVERGRAAPAAKRRGQPQSATAPSGSGPHSVRYAKSGDLNIAYQVTGSGSVDLLLVPGFVSHLDKDWDDPRHARFLERLGSFSRLIRFDKRGTGLSDRPGGLPDLEQRMDDVRAVMDAAGSERAVLFGYSEGGPMSILFAATYPERVQALVLYGVYAKRLDPDEDYPWAPTGEARTAHIDEVVQEWGFEAQLRAMCPSADEAMARWWGARARAAASPGAVRALMEMNSRIDVRGVLPAIRIPTLVIHRSSDANVTVEEGRYVADKIPGARFVELTGADHFVAIDPDQIVDVVEPFVATTPVETPSETTRVLKTILVSDVVRSTETAARVGDATWSRSLAECRAAAREALARFDGELVDAAGDGILALFDGPSRAIRCGLAIRERLAGMGLTLRVGVHTGEIEQGSDGVSGIAIHLAARVADTAEPGELLVTSTTHDLVEGSGLLFVERGVHELKGFERPRRLYVAAG